MLCVEFWVPEAPSDLSGTFQSEGAPRAAQPRGAEMQAGVEGLVSSGSNSQEPGVGSTQLLNAQQRAEAEHPASKCLK